MYPIFGEDAKTLEKLRQKPKRIKVNDVLNRDNLSEFELDIIMNKLFT